MHTRTEDLVYTFCKTWDSISETVLKYPSEMGPSQNPLSGDTHLKTEVSVLKSLRNNTNILFISLKYKNNVKGFKEYFLLDYILLIPKLIM